MQHPWALAVESEGGALDDIVQFRVIKTAPVAKTCAQSVATYVESEWPVLIFADLCAEIQLSASVLTKIRHYESN